jgi:TRAP-type mannitol/chloroaromatic compound transport system permease small subunit
MIEFLGTIFFGLLPLVLMVVIGLLSMACITDWWNQEEVPCSDPHLTR